MNVPVTRKVDMLILTVQDVYLTSRTNDFSKRLAKYVCRMQSTVEVEIYSCGSVLQPGDVRYSAGNAFNDTFMIS